MDKPEPRSRIAPVGMGHTTDRSDPDLHVEDERGQNKKYLVLSEEERAKGFVRPVRRTYVHDKCGQKTTMGLAIAQTYARDPSFYGATLCVHCEKHRPVGSKGEFSWADGSGKVGT